MTHSKPTFKKWPTCTPQLFSNFSRPAGVLTGEVLSKLLNLPSEVVTKRLLSLAEIHGAVCILIGESDGSSTRSARHPL
jgi:hypothetical protein